MAEYTMSISFSYGRCALRMASEEQSIETSAYRLHRSFAELVHCVVDLLKGRECVSCRWVTGEISGGKFIDFVADPDRHVNISIHNSEADAGARTYAAAWSATRSGLAFNSRVSSDHFFRVFADQLRRVRVLYVDHSGYLKHWGDTFPMDEYYYIQRAAARYGYVPTSTDDIMREHQ